jgi:hypothetical protein
MAWMFVEVGFSSEKEEKWKQESSAVEANRIYVTYIGPE